jgi:ankyrin repeat protein
MSNIEESRISPEVERFLRAARAGNVGDCKTMLDADASLVNSVEAGGYAALHFAAHYGNLQLLDLLGSYKPDYNIKNYDGVTPLMLAAKMKQHDSIHRLLELGTDINFRGKDGVTAAHHAAAMGNTATLRLLAELGANVSQTEASAVGSVLHWASGSGDIDIVGALIYEYNIDVNGTDANGGTPLFVACHSQKSKIVQFLLERGANPNAASKDGATPLHFAAQFCKADDVKTLLTFGAQADAKDSDGDTPLSIAEKKGDRDMIKEMSKTQPSNDKKLEDAARFKAHGNKVFSEGENVKASRFYTLAIAHEPKNHVYFSNRSACNFNMRDYVEALYDAKQCIRLNPTWPKGYVRLGATLAALKQFDAAKAAVAKGLAIDPNMTELKNLDAELSKK